MTQFLQLIASLLALVGFRAPTAATPSVELQRAAAAQAALVAASGTTSVKPHRVTAN